MTYFMIFAIFGYLSVLALLWCLRGFSRELKSGKKTIGLMVKAVPQNEGTARMNLRMKYMIRQKLKVLESRSHKGTFVHRAG